KSYSMRSSIDTQTVQLNFVPYRYSCAACDMHLDVKVALGSWAQMEMQPMSFACGLEKKNSVNSVCGRICSWNDQFCGGPSTRKLKIFRTTAGTLKLHWMLLNVVQ